MDTCPQCGSTIPPETTPGGLCPPCLLKLGLLENIGETAPTPRAETSSATPKTDALAATTDQFGPYKPIRVLGEGGMGIVYLAEQQQPIRRQVALKVIKLGMNTREVIARFESERQVLALMNHPNIARVFDAGASAQGLPYIVMEYVTGIPITEYCDQNRLSIHDRLEVFLPVSQAIHHAHGRGVIHRDIKPSNVLVSEMDGKPFPQVIDFGIAKATDQRFAEFTSFTQLGQLIGTPEYMSPEQAATDSVTIDARTDVYLLGVLVYHLLVGVLPFEREYLRRVGAADLPRILREEEPLDLSAKLDALKDKALAIAHLRRTEPAALRKQLAGPLNGIVMKALANDKTQRYSSASDLAEALRRCLIGPRRRDPALPRGPGPPAPSPTASPSIAVLPFAIMSADKEDEYFGDGLAEDIINALTRLPTLKVAARTSAFSFRGRTNDISEIGRKLGVASVLEGSVRKSANRIRVTVQLISVKDGFHIWSERYDRELTDVFAVQDDISNAIVEHLEVRLWTGEEPRKKHLPNIDAYQAYLKGRFFWNKRTEPDFDRSIEHFNRAIMLDPQFSLAHVGLSDACIMLGVFGLRKPQDAFEKARLAAETALRLDSTSAEALKSLATVLGLHDWDWKGAELTFQKAIALDPGSAITHFWHGSVLATAQYREQAIEEVKRARDLDPLSVPVNGFLGRALMQARRYDEAVEAATSAVELDPASPFARWMLTFCLDARNDFEAALVEAETAVSLSGGRQPFLATLGYAYARAGNRSGAELILEKLHKQSQTGYICPYDVGVIHAALGNNRLAFEWLEKAFQVRAARINQIADPPFDHLQAHPQIQSILKSMYTYRS
jgi:serine/threonine-protein kinase